MVRVTATDPAVLQTVCASLLQSARFLTRKGLTPPLPRSHFGARRRVRRGGKIVLTRSLVTPFGSLDRAEDGSPSRRAFPNPPALLRAAFGVTLHGDVYERASDLRLKFPLGPKRRTRLADIRKRGVLFIHVPKNAGTSISSILYGRSMRHETIRYYRHADRRLDMPSFAIWREPVERFCSAFDFVRNGGGRNVRLDPTFARRYAGFQTVDDALDHLEQVSSPYRMDYVFRPQSWFVCDSDGRLAVDMLFSLRDVAALPQRIEALRDHAIPHLNTTARSAQTITTAQRRRIERLYGADEDLRARLEKF
ncbi:hypothetical protein AA103193_1396 [Tanticharoenia sakaeratensis NBRC 103193]|nr:hypothetical protein AA103193_1396 [Tanticharoenia sakaeratensis NBRC 103193]